MDKGYRSRTRFLSVFIILMFLGVTFMAVLPATSEASGNHLLDDGPADTGSRASSRTSCSNRASGWSITGTATYTGTCTISGGHITIQNGANITFESLTLTHSGNYYYIFNYGQLRILNSTITGSGYWYGIYATSGSTMMKIENSQISSFRSYGTRAWYTTNVEIGNSTFDGKNLGSYGLYIYQASKGYIDNNTVKGTTSRGINIYYSSNLPLTYNTITNAGMYGIQMYYYSGSFENNTVTGGSSSTIYIGYNSPTSFRYNKVTGAGNGLYIYRTEISAYNCDLSGNTGNDVFITSSPGKLMAYDTKLGTANLASGTSLEVYWRANISVNWLSDASAVEGANIEITDALDNLDDRDLYTDANGEINNIYLMEYSKDSSATSQRSPYWVNATVDLSGRNIHNSTQANIKEGTNDVALILDDVPPPITITDPVDGYITNQTNVTVSGRTERNVSAEWPVTVEISLKATTYKPVVDTSGSFSQVVALPTDGTHDIDVTALDFVLNDASASVSVIRDTKAPPLTIDEPIEDTLTNITTMTVSGTTEVGVTLWVDEQEVTVDDNGDYSTDIELKEGDNTITVKAMDVAQNWIQDSVLVHLDTREPTLIVSEPADLYRTNEQSIRLIGVTEQKATVKINGNPVFLAGASFQTQLTLAEGDNSLKVTSCDFAMNCNVTLLHVFLDTIVPPLEITSPEDGYLTDQEEVEITGTTEEDAKVTVNSRDADLLGTQWSYMVTLREGKNMIKVEARDDVGNKVQQTMTIYKDTNPPAVYITSPEDGVTVNKMDLRVEGNTEANAVLTIDDGPVEVNSGMFSTTVSLKEGKNVIEASATDEAGNIGSASITVYLDTIVNVDVDGISEDTPLETLEGTINISGTADPDAKVLVNGMLVKMEKDGKFVNEVPLDIGENEVEVVATDPLGNEVVRTYSIVRNEPAPPPSTDKPIISGEGPLGGMLLPFLLIIIMVIVVIVVAVVIRKRRSAPPILDEPAQPQMAAPVIPPASVSTRSQPPAEPYQQYSVPPPPPADPGYDYSQQQVAQPYTEGAYNGAPPTQSPPPLIGTASLTPISEQAQQYYEEAERAIADAEAKGVDTTKNKRHFKIAKMFYQKGNSEKVIHYCQKAMAFE